jgi:protein-L-isoaspartate(D-aspartate) O-methyltransferase
MPDFQQLRDAMVVEHLVNRGISNPAVLAAMGRVPRELFVPPDARDAAYADSPLRIGAGQTISQPYIVAFMIEALQLRATDKVLEIGAGSGYAAAVLAEIAGSVYAIERIATLVAQARANLAAAGCTDVHLRHGDGTEGWPEAAPFDAILVSAGAPDVPATLEHQLAVGGRMVVPVGADPTGQVLLRITRQSETEFRREDLSDVRFVPLIGREGWHDPERPWYHHIEHLVPGAVI